MANRGGNGTGPRVLLGFLLLVGVWVLFLPELSGRSHAQLLAQYSRLAIIFNPRVDLVIAVLFLLAAALRVPKRAWEWLPYHKFVIPFVIMVLVLGRLTFPVPHATPGPPAQTNNPVVRMDSAACYRQGLGELAANRPREAKKAFSQALRQRPEWLEGTREFVIAGMKDQMAQRRGGGSCSVPELSELFAKAQKLHYLALRARVDAAQLGKIKQACDYIEKELRREQAI